MATLDIKMLGSFAGRVGQLRNGLAARAVSLDDIPEHIQRRWVKALVVATVLKSTPLRISTAPPIYTPLSMPCDRSAAPR